MREYRLYGFTDDVGTEICCYIFTDNQATNSFTTFYTICMVIKTKVAVRSITRWNTNMFNIDVEIMIMRCQSATIKTNINVTNTNNSITDIACTRPMTDIEFPCLKRFHNIRGSITNIIIDNTVILKCWRR